MYDTCSMGPQELFKLFSHGKKTKGDVKRLNSLLSAISTLQSPMTSTRRIVRPCISLEAYRSYCKIADALDTWQGQAYHGALRTSNIVLCAIALEGQELRPRNDVIVLASALIYFGYDPLSSEEENRSSLRSRIPSHFFDGLSEETVLDIFRVLSTSGVWKRDSLRETVNDPLLTTRRNLSDAEFLTTFGISYEAFLRDHRNMAIENGKMIHEDEALAYVRNVLYPLVGSGRNSEFGLFSDRLCNNQDVKSVPILKKAKEDKIAA